MKLILISGSAQDAIIKKITQVKKDFDPLAVTEISEKETFDLFNQSLFSDKRLVVLDSPNLKTVEQALNQKDANLWVLIKFLKPLEKTSPILKIVLEAKGEVLNFDESKEISIFPLLDMLGNLNQKAYLELEKNYQQFGGQYILTMLAYLLRRMVQTPKTGSDFMRQKIESQKKNFTLEKIQSLYLKLIATDFRIKQGLIEEKLAISLLVQSFLKLKVTAAV